MEAADIDLARAAPSLRDYDAERYGPLLGVSDEGSAAPAVVAAALGSPKASALPSPSPLEIGVAHDGERLGSIGETPIGPDEFATIRQAVAGQILITTNVGSHVNIWHYLRGPTAGANSGATGAGALTEALQAFAPYADGSDQRTIPIYLRMPADGERAPAADQLTALLGAVSAPTGVETKPVLVAEAAGDGGDTGGVDAALDLAAAARIDAVAVSGRARRGTEGRPVRPGLLHFYGVGDAQRLYDRAAAAGIQLRPHDVVDTESTANQIWAALETAHQHGASAGKFSLYPLTFAEMRVVLARIQSWFSDWTAAPAYYLDVETVADSQIFGPSSAAEGASRWLELVAETETPVVLIDTVDKAAGRHLVKVDSTDETGILTWGELRELDQLARRRHVKVLWAGGIRLDQVAEFGRLGCFGIYVTSAASERRPISVAYESDPAMTAEREPTRDRIAQTKALLEAGFLAERVPDGDGLLAPAEVSIGAERPSETLTEGLVDAWRRFWEPE